MNNKQYHDMEEKMQHRIVKFKYAKYIGICQKNMLIISKKKPSSKKNNRI